MISEPTREEHHGEQMQHMTLEEWDRKVAPYLATIGIRANHIRTDAKQITDWIKLLPAAPDFPTEAFSKLKEAQVALHEAVNEINKAILDYSQKDLVK